MSADMVWVTFQPQCSATSTVNSCSPETWADSMWLVKTTQSANWKQIGVWSEFSVDWWITDGLCVLPVPGVCVCYLDQVCMFRYPHSWRVEDQWRCGLVCCSWPACQPEPVGGGVVADRQPWCCVGYHANWWTFKPWDWQHHDENATWKTDGPITSDN